MQPAPTSKAALLQAGHQTRQPSRPFLPNSFIIQRKGFSSSELKHGTDPIPGLDLARTNEGGFVLLNRK